MLESWEWIIIGIIFLAAMGLATFLIIFFSVRKQITGVQPAPSMSVNEKEWILRDVTMSHCVFCGALTPEASKYCSNCGELIRP